MNLKLQKTMLTIVVVIAMLVAPVTPKIVDAASTSVTALTKQITLLKKQIITFKKQITNQNKQIETLKKQITTQNQQITSLKKQLQSKPTAPPIKSATITEYGLNIGSTNLVEINGKVYVDAETIASLRGYSSNELKYDPTKKEIQLGYIPSKSKILKVNETYDMGNVEITVYNLKKQSVTDEMKSNPFNRIREKDAIETVSYVFKVALDKNTAKNFMAASLYYVTDNPLYNTPDARITNNVSFPRFDYGAEKEVTFTYENTDRYKIKEVHISVLGQDLTWLLEE
jgi:hypothetical protein